MGNYVAMPLNEIITFYYDSVVNKMIDENGEIIFNIFDYITPNEYLLFKAHEETVWIQSKSNPQLVYEFVHPECVDY